MGPLRPAMNSLDFLAPRDVLEDCVRQAAIPSLAVALVGGIAWGVLAAMGKSTDAEPAYALLMPFAFSALYGNAVVYNVRWKHGVKVFKGHWWYRLTGLAVAWTASFVILGLVMNALLIHLQVLDRELPSLLVMAQVLGGAIAAALAMSLLPAKDPLVM